MPSVQLGYRKYEGDGGLYAVNSGDEVGDVTDLHPAIREMQEASRHAILNAIRKASNVVVKVSRLGPPLETVSGYVTLERFILESTPEQLEGILGFRRGVLRDGCRVSYPDVSTLTKDDIGPRFLTSWPAGVSPRDLLDLSNRAGAEVGYHRDYPVASDPIPQFTIFPKVRVRSTRILRPGERLQTT